MLSDPETHLWSNKSNWKEKFNLESEEVEFLVKSNLTVNTGTN